MSEPTRIEADYLVETAYDPRMAVEVMAGEQSSGTFIAVPGETPNSRPDQPRGSRRWSFWGRSTPFPARRRPTKRTARRAIRRARATLSWPIENMGPSLPNLLATIAGNLFELKQVSGLRLLDVRLPAPSPRPMMARNSALREPAASPALKGGRPSERSSSPASALAHRNRRCRRDAVRGRHRFHQGRRTSGRRSALPLRRRAPAR